MQNLSLLGWLVFQMQYSERDGGEMSAFRFPTGAQTFCEKMVESSDSVFHLNRALTRVERNPLGVDLFFGEEMHSFDRVILTLPPTCFDDIEFEPALSDAKQLAFENLELSRTTKVALEFDSKFWEINRLLSDGAYEQVWDGTRADGTPTLLCYLNGDGATPDIENLIDELDQAIPGVKQHLKATQVYNWREDAHAKGGFPFLAPGYVLEHMEHLPRSEDRIHFAGDYTSPWFGFIEGALESAERVCKEIG
jgi:monoamine oxidase